MILERYRPIVEDWAPFWEANHTPEPVCLRVRSGLISETQLREHLRADGFRLESVAGLGGYLRVTGGPGSVAQTIGHWMGFFHVQQAVMALPSLALGPRPGERVLDLCAAPGGKTTHLSELMHEEGPLVAVDPKEKRIRGLLGNLYRLGYSNVIVIAGDGGNLPDGAQFDRVLVDAPCSGEGNYRRQSRGPDRTSDFTSYVSKLQERLLRRAVALTVPGGVIVYSTCTYAPEENEAVLDRVLRDCPVTLEEIPLHFAHSPGLTAWQGERFHRDLAKSWRVYPHHMDSGGLFMGRLRRHGAPKSPRESDVHGEHECPPPGWEPIPAAFPGESGHEADRRVERGVNELVDRFGFSRQRVEEMDWMVRGKYVWSHSARIWPLSGWPGSGQRRGRIISVGLRALRGESRGYETPSSHFLKRWGNEIGEKRRVELDTLQLRELLRGEGLASDHLPVGPIALVWGGHVLGRGMVGSRGLLHELGRAHAERLTAILDGRGPGVDGCHPPAL